jgi:hypothetical protein
MATTNIVDKDGKTINAADATVPSDVMRQFFLA